MSVPSARALVVDSVLADPACVRVLDSLAEVGLPDAWLCAGAVFQNVWNRLSGLAAGNGIKDYDVFYFDAEDLGWEAEDRAIDAVRAAVAEPAIDVQVRNEARVHLWYPARFGTSIAPFTSSEDAMRGFAAFACAVGVRRAGNDVEVCAPFGLEDTVEMVLRPNRRLAPREVYDVKAADYARRWPLLRVQPW